MFRLTLNCWVCGELETPCMHLRKETLFLHSPSEHPIADSWLVHILIVIVLNTTFVTIRPSNLDCIGSPHSLD